MRAMRARVAAGARCLLLAGLATTSVVAGRPLGAQNWRDLSPAERYEALQNYHRHERLSEDRQRDVERRYERWRNMPDDERERVRQNFERFRQLPPQERERFERKYEKWKRRVAPGE